MIRLKSIRVTDPGWQEIPSRKTETKLNTFKSMLKDGKVIMTKWIPESNALMFAFSTGTIVSLFLKYASYQMDDIHIDKYLCHKITSSSSKTSSSSSSSQITDMIYREDEVILMSFSEPHLTAVFFTKNGNHNSNHKSSVKLKHKDLKFVDIDLDSRFTSSSMSNSRHGQQRHLLVSEDPQCNLCCLWWQSSIAQSRISVWSAPTKLDANIMIYSYEKSALRMIAYSLMTDEVRKIAFSTAHRNRLLILTSSTDLSMNFSVAEIAGRKEVRELCTIFQVTVPLQTPVLQADFTAAQDKLVILCQDRNCLIYDLNQNSATSLTTSIDASKIMSSPLDALFVICDAFGQLLMYDYALSVIPANYDDVCYKANLDFMDSISSVSFLNDHLICLRYTVTEDASSEITLISLPSGLDVPTLVREYLSHDYLSEAINTLVSISWNFDPYLCYTCLTIIFNFLTQFPLNPMRESMIESTLAAFFRPKQQLDHETLTQYSRGMNQLAKRFFFHLIRFNSLDKAFLLAVDLRSKHLFHLLLRISLENGNSDLAHRCQIKLEQIIGRERDRHQRRDRRHRNSSNEPAASQSDDSSRIRHQVSSAILVVDDEDEIDSAPRNRHHRPPIPAPRSEARTATFVEPVDTFQETVNVIRHVSLHPYPDPEYFHASAGQTNANFTPVDPYVHLIPPSLPPKRTTQTNHRTSTPSSSNARSPDFDALLQYSPPPVPPKTFLHPQPQHGNHDAACAGHTTPAATCDAVYATTTSVPFTGQSVVRSAAVRSTVNRQVYPVTKLPVNQAASPASNDQTENPKPRFECINFGLV